MQNYCNVIGQEDCNHSNNKLRSPEKEEHGGGGFSILIQTCHVLWF